MKERYHKHYSRLVQKSSFVLDLHEMIWLVKNNLGP